MRHKKCWVCGEPMGKYMSFVIGPMCGINRTISDPPSHTECAEFSAVNCPFLSRPLAKRRTDGVEDMDDAAGFAIKRNPGAVGVWTTLSYKTFRPTAGAPGILFEIGDPVSLEWYANGRPATSDESVATGLPILVDMAKQDGPEGLIALKSSLMRFEAMTGLWFPGYVPQPGEIPF
jgi:hypothetical protein